MTAGRRRKVFIVLDIVGLVAIVLLIPFVLSNKSAMANIDCSGKIGANHVMIIQNSKVTPTHITAPLCDTLTITNKDNIERFVAFGPHEDHVAYDGITEKVLTQGQTFKVTLVQAGNFRFHDHIHDEVQGTFTVTK